MATLTDMDCAFPPPQCPFTADIHHLTNSVDDMKSVMAQHGDQLMAAAVGIDAISRILTVHMVREEDLLDSMASRMAFQLRELQQLDAKANDATVAAVGDVISEQDRRISRAIYATAAVAVVNVVSIGGILLFHGLRFWGLV